MRLFGCRGDCRRHDKPISPPPSSTREPRQNVWCSYPSATTVIQVAYTGIHLLGYEPSSCQWTYRVLISHHAHLGSICNGATYPFWYQRYRGWAHLLSQNRQPVSKLWDLLPERAMLSSSRSLISGPRCTLIYSLFYEILDPATIAKNSSARLGIGSCVKRHRKQAALLLGRRLEGARRKVGRPASSVGF